jgi:D-alanyl-D-alanine carboxypeptidase
MELDMNRKGIQSFLSILIIGTVLIVGCSKADKDSVYLQEPHTGSQEADALAETRDYIEDLAAKDQFCGAVLIAKDGVPLLKEAYGLANRSYEVPNRVDTKFNLGSMNKMFTAVNILQLVEQGKLGFDDTIGDYLPGYPNKEVANQVTIHHLLTHTSGLGDIFTAEFARSAKDRFKDVRDYLPLFVDQPLKFEPGTQFSYSNAGFIVLGLIVEKVSGRTYFDYVMENIYRPSGMINTDAYELDYPVPNLSVGYTEVGAKDGALKNNYYTNLVKGSPAGGGYSTVEDLLNFSRALTDHELLSPELTKVLLEGKVTRQGNVKYAYGFSDSTVNGHRLVGHGGGAPGVCSNLDIYVDLGYTVVVLSNTDEGCRLVYDFIREELLR